jgi:RluA family pseudouridine synthase
MIARGASRKDQNVVGRGMRAPAPKLDFASWIVFEDAWLLAVDKPAGVLSQGGEGGEGINVVDLARAHLGKPTVGVLHRIDRNVSGVVLIAKDHGIASAMTKLFATGAVERVYRAIVRGSPEKDIFTIDAWLKKDERTNEVRARKDEAPGFRPAKTDVRVIRRMGAKTELEVRPITGRSHQIRVHLAFAGLPIVGDPKYGVADRSTNRPLLHAERVSFMHPRTKKRVTIEAPIPWK